jgi:hypothetical protein
MPLMGTALAKAIVPPTVPVTNRSREILRKQKEKRDEEFDRVFSGGDYSGDTYNVVTKR